MSLSWSLKLCDYVGLNQWRVNGQMMPVPVARDGCRANPQKLPTSGWGTEAPSPP